MTVGGGSALPNWTCSSARSYRAKAAAPPSEVSATTDATVAASARALKGTKSSGRHSRGSNHNPSGGSTDGTYNSSANSSSSSISKGTIFYKGDHFLQRGPFFTKGTIFYKGDHFLQRGPFFTHYNTLVLSFYPSPRSRLGILL